MKTALLAIWIFALSTYLRADPANPPILPLPKAAEIAQRTLDDLNLPPQYFLRYIAFHPSSDNEAAAYFLAAFEPKEPKTVIADLVPKSTPSPTPSTTPTPANERIIKVLMDGSASVVDRNTLFPFPNIRR